jgi:alpha-tubulin suppressor-like RCC1 family protein
MIIHLLYQVNFVLKNIEKGIVYSFGGNKYGELGLGHNNNTNVPTKLEFFKDMEIKKIVCNYGLSFFLLSNYLFKKKKMEMFIHLEVMIITNNVLTQILIT